MRSLIIATVVFGFAACWLLVPIERWAPPPPNYLPEHVEMTQMSDTLRQRVAYQVWLGVNALTSLCILFWPRWK